MWDVEHAMQVCRVEVCVHHSRENLPVDTAPETWGGVMSGSQWTERASSFKLESGCTLHSQERPFTVNKYYEWGWLGWATPPFL